MKPFLNPSFIARLLWMVMIGAVVVGSLSPGNSSLITTIGRLQVSDKVLHFTGYLLLAVLPVFGLRKAASIFWAVAAIVLLGVLLEIGQRFVPGRSPDVLDGVANLMGAGCGMAVAFPFRSTSGAGKRTDR